MKVLLPEGKKLKGFERQLQETLEQANLAGCALMGFAFQAVRSGGLREIDAVVVMKPGIFVCLEAKGYEGEWTGSANERWMSDGREIKSVTGNPYMQVDEYIWIIRDRLKQEVFNDVECFVNSFIVAPDNATIAIQNAVVDRFKPGRAVRICHCSKLEEVLGSIYAKEDVKAKFTELGLKRIVSKLTNIPIEKLDDLDSRNPPSGREPCGIKEPTPDVSPDPKPEPPAGGPMPSNWAFKPIAIGIICASVLLAATAATAQYFWSNRPCKVSTETRINNTCYKDLARTPLRIGILSPPEQYVEFKSYLERQLGPNALAVVIEGGSDISYVEVQNKIAKREWDIVFAFSPMNGMRAKDNGYVWLARMFPQFTPTYQAAIFVRVDSKIQSLSDIKTTTKVALGDFNSASSFYMPTYDFYGKTMTVTAGHRGSKIKDLVASGVVDAGAGAHAFVDDDPRFRIIHVSREIPGSGVYISPKIAPASQEQIRHILMSAPEEIKQAANYGEGQEPDYELFRAVSLRADEVMRCANFDQQPVQFFCNSQNNQQAPQPSDQVTGKITGFTNEGNGMVRLRFEEKGGKVCQLSIALKVLSSIPNGTSPGMINRKQVSLTGVKLEQSPDSSCVLEIIDPKQVTVAP